MKTDTVIWITYSIIKDPDTDDKRKLFCMREFLEAIKIDN